VSIAHTSSVLDQAHQSKGNFEQKLSTVVVFGHMQ